MPAKRDRRFSPSFMRLRSKISEAIMKAKPEIKDFGHPQFNNEAVYIWKHMPLLYKESMVKVVVYGEEAWKKLSYLYVDADILPMVLKSKVPVYLIY